MCTTGRFVVSDDDFDEEIQPEETAVTPLSTGDGGKPANSVDRHAPDTDADPIKLALRGAQRIARGQPRRPSRGGQRRGKPADDTSTRGGYSGAHPDDTDPHRVGDVFNGYLQDRGWERPIQQARVFTDWAEIVGADVAAHCRPVSLNDGELRVAAESTAWATQLRLLGGTLLARVVAELGPTVVTRIVVTGPSGPSWKHGKFSVRGARGPRDTYG
jgi:predicted nucleic acid-binding Zn ribbon protein